jgi:hypothetical protein
MAETDSPVAVASFVGLAEAEIARGVLESAGIRVWMANEHLVSLLWHYSQATGGVRLMVAGEDAARARELLDAHETPLEAVDEDTRAPGDALIERAWKSTVIGFIGLPPAFHLWALWLLRGAYAKGGPRTERGRKLAARTAVVSGSMVLLSGAIALRAILR